MYQAPDDSSHDARLVSKATNGSVLYVRGSDPMYVSVKGQEFTCTGTFKVEIMKRMAFPRM